MGIKITIPNTSSDVLTFGSGNTPTAAQIAGIDSGSSNGQLALYTTASGTSTERVRINASGNVGIGTSSPIRKLDVYGDAQFKDVSGVASTVWSEISTGVGAVGTDNNYPFAFATNGIERARIDTSGNLLVGATAKPTTNFYGLYVKSSTTSSADWGFYVDNSAGTSIIRARNDGYVNLLSTYSNTTASAANMFVDSTGYVYRSTSSIKYKTDVQNATHGLVDLLKLRSVTYKQKTENAENNVPSAVFGGLIAEEVHEAGLTEFVQYAEDGSPDALAYGNMVSLCIKAIQELKALVDTQASTITSLTDRLTALENK